MCTGALVKRKRTFALATRACVNLRQQHTPAYVSSIRQRTQRQYLYCCTSKAYVCTSNARVRQRTLTYQQHTSAYVQHTSAAHVSLHARVRQRTSAAYVSLRQQHTSAYVSSIRRLTQRQYLYCCTSKAYVCTGSARWRHQAGPAVCYYLSVYVLLY
jgi:hypothetical protein